MATYTTGKIKNPNAKVTKQTTPKGRVGGTSVAPGKEAVKSAKPKGRSGGTSTAPKKASPSK